MSRNEDITTGIWVDLMDLSPEAKLLYVWSWTNEHNNMAGLYKVHRSMIELETGVRGERLTAVLRELADADFAFYVDGVMFVRTRVKRLRQKTWQIARSVARSVSEVHPDHPLRVRLIDMYGAQNWLRQAFSDAQLRRSGEPQGKARGQGESLTLSNASLEASGSEGVVNTSSKATDGGQQQHDHARKTKRVDQSLPPSSLSDDLKPRLDAVLPILEAVQDERGGDVPTVRGVGLAIVRFPDRDHVGVARQLEHWALAGTGQRRPVKDWSRTYCTFLDGAPAGAPVRTANGGDSSHLPEHLRPTDDHQAQIEAHLARQAS